jgi:hypothetical protein
VVALAGVVVPPLAVVGGSVPDDEDERAVRKARRIVLEADLEREAVPCRRRAV